MGLPLQEVACCAAQSPWVSGGLFAAQEIQVGGMGGRKGKRDGAGAWCRAWTEAGHSSRTRTRDTHAGAGATRARLILRLEE